MKLYMQCSKYVLKNEQSWRRNESNVSESFKTFFKRDDPTELSGSCSGESSRLVPITVEDDLEVELTLSIGRCTRGNKSRCLMQQCNPQFLDFDRSNPVEETSSLSGVNTGKDEAYGEPSAALNQDNEQLHWLLQNLSLSRR